MGERSMKILNYRYTNPPIDHEERWYAVYTMYKSEKQIAIHLERKGINVYLPQITKTKRYNRKIKTYNVPLINCYVFVKIKMIDHVKVLETEHVIKFIKQGKEMIAIPQEEIDILRRIEGLNVESASESIQYEVGDLVEITKGSLAGLKGKLVTRLGKKQFIVEIESIGVSLQLNINIEMLNKIRSIKSLTA
jgi:transcription antitermination factor NusG